MRVVWVSAAKAAVGEPRPSCAPCGRATCAPTVKLRSMVELAYPEEAQRRGIRGTVVIEFLIDKKGLPHTIRVLKGHPTLASAVSQAVQQWRWRPYRRNREAVELEMMIAVNFEPDFALASPSWTAVADPLRA